MLDLSEELRRSVDNKVTPVSVDEIFDRVERNRNRASRWRHHRGALVGSFAVGAIAVGLIAAFIVVSQGGFNNSPGSKQPATDPSAEIRPTLSVLDRAPTKNDVLPPSIATQVWPSGAAPLAPFVRDSLRLALDADGWLIYIGQSNDYGNGDFCVLTVEPPPGATSGESRSWGSSCSTLSVLASGDIPTTADFSGDSPIASVVGVVPDGTKSVTIDGSKATLGDNVFLATGIDRTNPVEMRITSADGTRTSTLPGRPSRP